MAANGGETRQFGKLKMRTWQRENLMVDLNGPELATTCRTLVKASVADSQCGPQKTLRRIEAKSIEIGCYGCRFREFHDSEWHDRPGQWGDYYCTDGAVK